MRSALARWLVSLAGAVFLTGLLNIGAGYWVLKRLEKKAGAPIQGIFIPHLIQASFTFKNASLEWQNRFRVTSGTFVVHYEPLSLLPGGKFRTQISGHDLAVQLFGELAESQGRSQVKIDRVEADLAFSKGRTPEIFLLHVQSPEIRLHLVKNP